MLSSEETGPAPFAFLSREVKVSATENYQQRRVHYACHEAGHALVSHVIGRCIEEVSIGMRDDGYGG